MIDPGFDPAPTLDVAVDVGLRQYDEAKGRDFYRRLLERVEAIPGVRSATLAQLVPLTGSNQETGVQLEGAEPPADGRRPKSYFNYVAPGYFGTLGIALARGRDFTANDREGAPGVVIVNEEAARRLWPGAAPIGKRLSMNGTEGPYLEVIGVARISKYNTLGESAQPFMYIPFLQDYQSEMVLHVRAAGGDPRSLAAPVRDAVQSLDPALPIGDVKLLADEIRFALIPARAGATLLGAFGGLALLLATVGIYGVTSYAVAQRTREIGIRGALGADGRWVIGMVIGECMRLAAIGVAIGLGLAFAVTRVAAGVLYGVSPTDPATFAGTALLLLAVAALASFIPARRASRVDPMVALRSD
ncbi:MAG: FtsX-like permease family protein [Gemmatimonadaceae bacterium]